MIPFGAGINGALDIGRDLGANQYESAWIAASYPSVLPPNPESVHSRHELA